MYIFKTTKLPNSTIFDRKFLQFSDFVILYLRILKMYNKKMFQCYEVHTIMFKKSIRLSKSVTPFKSYKAICTKSVDSYFLRLDFYLQN